MKDLIKAITEIANHPNLSKHVEPNIMQHYKVEEWQVKRILYAYALYEQERRKK